MTPPILKNEPEKIKRTKRNSSSEREEELRKLNRAAKEKLTVDDLIDNQTIEEETFLIFKLSPSTSQIAFNCLLSELGIAKNIFLQPSGISKEKLSKELFCLLVQLDLTQSLLSSIGISVPT